MPDVVTERLADPAADMALTRALLAEVADGRAPLVRVFRPAPTLAFGRRDGHRAGFAAAARAARAHGFVPVLRSAGGHAVAYDEGCVLVERVTPAAEVAAGVRARFDAAAADLVGVLGDLGLDARIGPLPGEYCAGEHSVNVEGRIKVAGLAQRVVRGAALVTCVLVVADGEGIRAVVADVYDALGIDHDPRVTGALADADPGLRARDVARTLERRVGDGAPPVPAGATAVGAAWAHAGRHAVDAA